jgi:hypothetical protein
MDYTAEAMQKTLDIAKPEIHDSITDVHGIQTNYSTKPLHQIKAAPPEEPQGVNVNTLTGFADLVREKLEGKDFTEEFLIHVQDEGTVTLKAKQSDQWGRRLVLIQAQPVKFDRFKFGQWLGQEEFAIAVAALFADTEDKQYVLNMASILTSDATNTSEDDGFTQRVNVKAGLRMKEAAIIKPRVQLAPYRTFPEIDQPVSEFVFRARCNGEAPPMLMLVEADGGLWKIDAITEIKRAMEAFTLNIPIIA